MGVTDTGVVEGDVAHLLRSPADGRVGQQHLERTGTVGVAADVTLALEDAKLMCHRRRARQAHRQTDLAHAGRIPARLHRVTDDGENPPLPRRQSKRVRWAVGELMYG
jgi:hypothetical protein